jgi:Flp pilus assembly protein TadG
MIGLLRRHLARDSRGQALIETAIALPIVLVLSLSAFDLGRGIVAHIALTEATQDGAFYAAYNPFPAATIITRVNTSSNAEAVTGAAVTVPTCTTSPGTGQVIVRSTYELPVTSPPAQAIFGPTFTLTVEITATNFNGACS